MAIFKIVISEPKSRKSFQIEVDQSKATGLVGKKIGDEFSGDTIGFVGYMLQITGGTDKDGFPMHPGLGGSGRKKLLLTEPPGFHPGLKGQRRRKTVRGNTISDAVVQINVKIVKMGEKPLEQLIPKKEAPKEAPKEEKPKEEKRAEVKKPEKKPIEKEAEKPEVKEKVEEKKPDEKPKEKPAEQKPEEKKTEQTETEKTGGGESKDEK
jgi:small subunit ribosomal protein S6e